MPKGTLYVIGTPIGNLDDLSPRARRALGESALVACEDTRKTRVLLTRCGLRTPLRSHHKFNEARGAEGFLEVLRRGAAVALVSDGGTPGLSDPGALLVRRAREEGHAVVPIPGASAVTALWSASGFPPGSLTVVGFLPHRQGERRRALAALRDAPAALLFFEAPHRLVDSLEDMQEILGDRPAFLGREMTKLHEEFLAGPLSGIRRAFAGKRVRGEIALLVEGGAAGPGPETTIGRATTPAPPEPIAAAVQRLIGAGWDRKEAMRRVARERGLSRRDVYRALVEAEGDEP
jgi:16S rRNA (cytidine1402-2'-O)-methyltransferase